MALTLIPNLLNLQTAYPTIFPHQDQVEAESSSTTPVRRQQYTINTTNNTPSSLTMAVVTSLSNTLQ